MPAIRVSDETFRRLQAFGTGFSSSVRGTPEKALAALLDQVEAAGGRLAAVADRLVVADLHPLSPDETDRIAGEVAAVRRLLAPPQREEAGR